MKVIDYIVGNFRYRLYYSKYKKLIRKHIRSQINLRIAVMNQNCYFNGSCEHCGCTTTALQMAKRSCDGEYYPPLVNRKNWSRLMRGDQVFIGGNLWRIWKFPVLRDKIKIQIFKNNHLVKDINVTKNGLEI